MKKVTENPHWIFRMSKKSNVDFLDFFVDFVYRLGILCTLSRKSNFLGLGFTLDFLEFFSDPRRN